MNFMDCTATCPKCKAKGMPSLTSDAKEWTYEYKTCDFCNGTGYISFEAPDANAAENYVKILNEHCNGIN